MLIYGNFIDSDPEILPGKPRIKDTRISVEHILNELVDLVKARFPNLVEEAQQKVKQVDNPDVLNFLLVGIGSAANEVAAHHLLHPSAA